MSEQDGGLLAGASATPAETPAQQPEISHRAEQTPNEAAATAPPKVDSGHKWVEDLTGSLYKDGKPNFEALPEKYWRDGNPDLGAALKARAELEKKFSRGEHKAPETYALDVLKSAGVPEDDPLAGTFAAWAKEQGISQDAFNKLAGAYLEVAGKQAEAVKVNVEAERQKLGPNAEKVIGETISWAQSLVQKGIWGPDDFEEFKIMGGTAQGIRALVKLREYYGDIQKIPLQPNDPEGRPSKEELFAMVGDPRYQSDPAFRRKVERMFEENFG